jgi:thiamine-phosphate pyrophosphorylase
MPSELTPAVERALDAAQTWARRLGTVDVRPVHLLLGLLEEEEGRAALLLQEAGLAPAAARKAFGELAAAQPHPSATPLPLHPDTQALFAAARELAAELFHDRTIPGEVLVFALLRQDEPLRPGLVALGLDPSRIEAEIAAVRQPPLRLDEPLELADATEEIDTARILDAASNRAREALRAVEDHARFVLDDAFLCDELKRLRHDLTAALADLPEGLLLAARETLRDVGTDITTPGEQERHSARETAQVNFKRLEEALRSLEEYGKVFSPDLGRKIESLRYRSYTLERAALLRAAAGERLASARLYVILTRSQCAAALDWTIAEAAAGGANIIQLREKQRSDRQLFELAREVRRWTRQAGVLFIMNDRPDMARLVEADGVHLGQDDLPVKEARRILGPEALIGVSTHNLEQVRQAVLDGASYIGVGPTFPSGTKSFEELAGLEFVRQATAETSLPAFVIGGINLQTIGAAVAAGAQRVAVSQVIAQADDPRAVAAALCRALTSPAPG